MTVDRSAFEVVDRFEQRLCEYTGAPFCVTTDSCTNALYLCFVRHLRTEGRDLLFLPRFTYVGVVRAAENSGLWWELRDIPWVGEYEILPTRIWDAARWLRREMYRPSTWTCLSFQAAKHLPIGRGGAILCDNAEDADWFRKARFDGREMHTSIMEQREFQWGVHCYMDPPSAARGLWLMQGLADENAPLPGEYPDLSKVRFL